MIPADAPAPAPALAEETRANLIAWLAEHELPVGTTIDRDMTADALMADFLGPLLTDRTAQAAEIAALKAVNARLLIAFHDAVRRPLGVTPDSGIEFYDQRLADEAEARRPPISPSASLRDLTQEERYARAATLADATRREREAARAALSDKGGAGQ